MPMLTLMKQVLVRNLSFFVILRVSNQVSRVEVWLIHYYPLSLHNIVRLEAIEEEILFPFQRIAPGAPEAGDCGTLIASPFMISCIEASKASTLVDIWFTGIE